MTVHACPRCRATLNPPQGRAGGSLACPSCGARLRISGLAPKPQAAPTVPAQPARKTAAPFRPVPPPLPATTAAQPAGLSFGQVVPYVVLALLVLGGAGMVVAAWQHNKGRQSKSAPPLAVAEGPPGTEAKRQTDRRPPPAGRTPDRSTTRTETASPERAGDGGKDVKEDQGRSNRADRTGEDTAARPPIIVVRD